MDILKKKNKTMKALCTCKAYLGLLSSASQEHDSCVCEQIGQS